MSIWPVGLRTESYDSTVDEDGEVHGAYDGHGGHGGHGGQ